MLRFRLVTGSRHTPRLQGIHVPVVRRGAHVTPSTRIGQPAQGLHIESGQADHTLLIFEQTTIRPGDRATAVGADAEHEDAIAVGSQAPRRPDCGIGVIETVGDQDHLAIRCIGLMQQTGGTVEDEIGAPWPLHRQQTGVQAGHLGGDGGHVRGQRRDDEGLGTISEQRGLSLL